MIYPQDISVRDAADLLQIDPLILGRLCRALKIDAGIQRLPPAVVARAGEEETADERYAVLRTWLLHGYGSTDVETR